MKEERLIRDREQKFKEWLREEGNPYEVRFVRSSSTGKIREKYENLSCGEKTEVKVSLGGRIINRRRHGKVTFADIKDGEGKIQLYIRYDTLGEKKYTLFQKLDLGDIIGVEGKIFKTATGELTIEVFSFFLLAKSFRSLPEKWHGLQNVELRYRKRYLDLLCNSKVEEIFIQRGQIIKSIREFLDKRGFLEVETPVMQLLPGGATARPFRTYHNALEREFYLRIAPELYLKKLIVGGMEKVYELSKNFRNEGVDRFHNPEFTMLEVYAAYSNYEDMMKLSEELVSSVVRKIKGTLRIRYQKKEIDFSPPWKRITFEQALKKIGGVQVDYKNEKQLKEVAKREGLNIEGLSRAQILEHLLERKVSSYLVQPTFVFDYPQETSPLAKRKKDDPSLIERFEIFVGGEEIGNAYSELNDPLEQRERMGERKDEDFLEALEYGMPPTGGLGIGIDRLVMLLTDSSSIREVILFPQMRAKSIKDED